MISPGPILSERKLPMAKGQMRSNKEVKKPKKDKSKVTPEVNSLTANFKAQQEKQKAAKK